MLTLVHSPERVLSINIGQSPMDKRSTQLKALKGRDIQGDINPKHIIHFILLRIFSKNPYDHPDFFKNNCPILTITPFQGFIDVG